MSKLIKFTGILMAASFIFISVPPSNTEANQKEAYCNEPLKTNVERICSNGITSIVTHYRQDCYFSNGDKETKRWKKAVVVGTGGCALP